MDERICCLSVVFKGNELLLDDELSDAVRGSDNERELAIDEDDECSSSCVFLDVSVLLLLELSLDFFLTDFLVDISTTGYNNYYNMYKQ